MASLIPTLLLIIISIYYDLSVFVESVRDNGHEGGSRPSSSSSQPSSIDVINSKIDDWYVLDLPAGIDCLYYGMLIMLTGRAGGQRQAGSNSILMDEPVPSVRALRRQLQEFVEINGHGSSEAYNRLLGNLLGVTTTDYTANFLYDVTTNLANGPGDLRALKIFAYFLGQPIHVLFGITSTMDALDWGIIQWDGKTNNGPVLGIEPAQHLGPPFAFAFLQDCYLQGKHWTMLVHKSLVDTLLFRSSAGGKKSYSATLEPLSGGLDLFLKKNPCSGKIKPGLKQGKGDLVKFKQD